MASGSSSASAQRALIILTGTIVGVVVIVCLYWAHAIFIPVAFAVFLTFLLSPLVTALHRWGLGRTPAVLVVVLFAGLVLAGIVWLITAQLSSLIQELPAYSENINGKIKTLRDMVHNAAPEQLAQVFDDVGVDRQPRPRPSTQLGPPDDSGRGQTQIPQPVFVQSDNTFGLSWFLSFFFPLAESLAGGLLAIVLCIFMLLKREDLRNRFIGLVGHGRITVTTKAVEEAGQRISRFLFMQAIVNGGYGVAIGMGLELIGVKYALLWGFLAGVSRYIPYIGVWFSAVLPILVSLVQFDGWTLPLLVTGLFLVIELITSNIAEPWLYGHSMGVSEVALLVAAAFWAFLWGPIGMVLSNPLTVCLVVLGKYVPQLRFLDVLLGDEPVLDGEVSFYQRLLARDQDEATDLALVRVRGQSPERVFDDLLVPALIYAKKDRERDRLAEDDWQFVSQATREIVEELSELKDVARSEEHPSAPEIPLVAILGSPARDEADALALLMLQGLLDPARWKMEIAGGELLTAELIQRVTDTEPALLCIGSLPPDGLAHTRYLCKRLRAQFPHIKIVVGRWGLRTAVELNQKQLREAGADLVTLTLLETRNQINAWRPVLAQRKARNPLASTGKKRPTVEV